MSTEPAPSSRRDFLFRSGGGLGGIALASMLAGKSAGAASVRPKAKRVIQLFMAGAASHIDTFDHKPLLTKLHGQPSDFGEHVEAFQNGLGPWMKSPWEFSGHGRSGKMLSEPVAALGEVVDQIAFIHNMVGKTGVHSQATYLQATGFQRPGFPGMGNWVSYALGSMTENLPTFVVLPDHRGYASNGPKNWAPAFLPARDSGVVIFPGRKDPIADLVPHAGYITEASEREGLALLNRINTKYMESRSGDSRMDARIRSYELAARMQLSAPEAMDISREPANIKDAYGVKEHRTEWGKGINVPEEIHHMGVKCLTARRLLERGVRFVQIWSGNDNRHPRRNWDSHENIERDHGALAAGMAKPIAALIKDLEQRGMLEDTLVHWTTEFGRMPSTQGSVGRDHNPYVFTNWLAGGGVQGGITHGESDAWGYKPLDRSHPTEVYDMHATMLHLLGLDHKRLTVRHDGIDRRLTDVHGRVIHDVLV